MKRVATFFVIFLLVSCGVKEFPKPQPENINVTPALPPNGYVLVDATRDGRAWWYPQISNCNPYENHLGKSLVDYIQHLGYAVDELRRGATITKDMLKKYKLVIRAAASSNYSTEELMQYQQFLKGTNSLLVMTDSPPDSINDNLSEFLGLHFEGFNTGSVVPVLNHPITDNVVSLSYVGGAVIRNPNLNWITVLGYYSDANIQHAAAMGIIMHPTSKIFFIGDVRTIENMPQPFTDNLFRWLLK